MEYQQHKIFFQIKAKKQKKDKCHESIYVRYIFLLTIILGASIGLGAVIDFADYMFLTLAIPNLIGLYLMSGEISKDLNSYFSKIKSGEIPKTK